MVDNDYLVLFVLVVVQLGQVLVPFDVRTRVVQSLFDVEVLELLGFSEVQEKELGVEVHWELGSLDCHVGEGGGGLAHCV